MNKYGFWIVIETYPDGVKNLCNRDSYGWENRAMFLSEQEAQDFVDTAKKLMPPDWQYYWKFIPWGEYA